jgi:hypothetical protein
MGYGVVFADDDALFLGQIPPHIAVVEALVPAQTANGRHILASVQSEQGQGGDDELATDNSNRGSCLLPFDTHVCILYIYIQS